MFRGTFTLRRAFAGFHAAVVGKNRNSRQRITLLQIFTVCRFVMFSPKVWEEVGNTANFMQPVHCLHKVCSGGKFTVFSDFTLTRCRKKRSTDVKLSLIVSAGRLTMWKLREILRKEFRQSFTFERAFTGFPSFQKLSAFL